MTERNGRRDSRREREADDEYEERPIARPSGRHSRPSGRHGRLSGRHGRLSGRQRRQTSTRMTRVDDPNDQRRKTIGLPAPGLPGLRTDRLSRRKLQGEELYPDDGGYEEEYVDGEYLEDTATSTQELPPQPQRPIPRRQSTRHNIVRPVAPQVELPPATRHTATYRHDPAPKFTEEDRLRQTLAQKEEEIARLRKALDEQQASAQNLRRSMQQGAGERLTAILGENSQLRKAATARIKKINEDIDSHRTAMAALKAKSEQYFKDATRFHADNKGLLSRKRSLENEVARLQAGEDARQRVLTQAGKADALESRNEELVKRVESLERRVRALTSTDLSKKVSAAERKTVEAEAALRTIRGQALETERKLRAEIFDLATANKELTDINTRELRGELDMDLTELEAKIVPLLEEIGFLKEILDKANIPY